MSSDDPNVPSIRHSASFLKYLGLRAMPFKKGQTGNPGGRRVEKMFADAVRLIVNEKCPDTGKKKLRRLMEKLYDEAMAGSGWAMAQIADRLDGKPAQEATVTLEDKRDATDWTRDELVAFLDDAHARRRGTTEANGSNDKSDRVH